MGGIELHDGQERVVAVDNDDVDLLVDIGVFEPVARLDTARIFVVEREVLDGFRKFVVCGVEEMYDEDDRFRTGDVNVDVAWDESSRI